MVVILTLVTICTHGKQLFCFGKNDAGQCGFFSWGAAGPQKAETIEAKQKAPDQRTPKPADVMEPTRVKLQSESMLSGAGAAASAGKVADKPRMNVAGAAALDKSGVEENCLLQVACGEAHTLALVGEHKL